ncbi:hypothetical protein K458DRAFT_288827 [Lentithecium fluviatile CBS 122367]|uniref:Large ribosomal subunit protein uL23m n=1 Tax=Lentithecium fluviatile CBS 122367 TaxID=1168545 RepID=A0A6G1JM35_9PLEO|nr:hypothetical protein K458DRAFT_288827 [Lentithecium fluviatile CBS 122367]
MDAVPVSKKIIAFGSKQIFLPKFTIALTRTPSLSPYHARFQVPLNFSKFDLRDYLFHAYRIKCHNIRSYVKQMPVRDTREQPRHFFREESKKYMTVEMDTPFVWPKEPKSWEPWGKKDRKEAIKDMSRGSGAPDHEAQRKEMEALRVQAKEMLGGKPPRERKAGREGAKKGKEEEALGEKNKNKKVLDKSPRESILRKAWEQKRSPRILGRAA